MNMIDARLRRKLEILTDAANTPPPTPPAARRAATRAMAKASARPPAPESATPIPRTAAASRCSRSCSYILRIPDPQGQQAELQRFFAEIAEAAKLARQAA